LAKSKTKFTCPVSKPNVWAKLRAALACANVEGHDGGAVVMVAEEGDGAD